MAVVFRLLFHYCILLIFIRHFRFFLEPVPACITFLESIDGIMQVGSPRFYWTGGLALAALLFLLGRRLFNHRLRYMSLLNDYFPLWLLLGIVGTGLCLRYFDKTEIAQVKVFVMGLVRFAPVSARRHQRPVLRTPYPGQRAADLLPFLQARAHAGRVLQPNPQHAQ